MRKTVVFQDKNIVYELTGKGPALLLLHGFLESRAIWNDFTRTLQEEFKVIAIDLPGHGESDLLSEIHSMDLMASAVKAVLLAEQIEKVVVAGHSMGGYVALQFAADNKEMLSGLVLFHSHAGADNDAARENRRRTIEIVKQNRGGFIKQFIPELFDQEHVAGYAIAIRKLQDQADLLSPEAIIAALSGMRQRPDQSSYLLSTETPVLFILGKQDSRMPFNQLLVQVVMPSHSEMLLLDHVGHMGFIEAPYKTLPALKHFALRCFEK
ncbi:MAG: alpha/beta hydrolase [Bacteroidota bacterium]